ncbi:NRDE-2, necessary for RNA interference-domain-containing protein [Syncephalastrum racemosum]|uniref:NRDE-2, necessary for RNA interference-domain-containing protein n=1 Tax=Syncephalastrum racemosum TaxID=13706 RepID=A0A1X2HLW3_SYNRA|nr:NRDE-2, necessary for RNA interference-domain-containing protein [Syncephalastrum racemosum]
MDQLPVPSFSFAPSSSLPEQDNGNRREKRSHEKKRRRTPSPLEESSSRRRSRRERSRSPPRSSRKRSRSPHRSSRKSRKRARSPRSDRYRHKSSRQRSRSPEEKEPPPVRGLEKIKGTDITFYVDKRGDRDLGFYGTTHSYSVPSYKYFKRGLVLGLDPPYRLEFSKESNKYYFVKGKGGGSHNDKNLLDKIPSKPVRLRTQIEQADSIATQTDFVELTKPKAVKSEGFISSGVDYRDIEGPAKAEPEEDEEGEDTRDETIEDIIRKRTIEFDRHLREHPEDVEQWLAFISFQDEAAKDLNAGSESKKALRNSLIEVKMSIYEKALEKNPDNEDLILSYLSCGEEFWETLELLRQWDRVLKRRPESIRLWADYINLRQTNFSSFSFTQCAKVFEDCIYTLNKAAIRLQQRRKSEDNSEARENVESVMVYVFLRACLFMKQCGYQERAFGQLQALAEFNLYQPLLFEKSLDVTFEDKLSEFEAYWDSELPRFGEKDAKGWAEYYTTNYDDSALPKHNDEDDADMDSDEEGLGAWIRHEDATDRKHRLPVRLGDIDPDAVDDDPYMVALFDDVKTLLFSVTTYEAKQGLVYSILVFLGLPFTPPGVGTNTHFCIDTFTHNEMALPHFWPRTEERPPLITYIDGVAMAAEHIAKEANPFELPVSYPVGLAELFPSARWFDCFDSARLDNVVDMAFARNALKSLQRLQSDIHLALCHLALEYRLSYESARELAKTLLSEHRTSLTLWNAYAQLEKNAGKFKEARKVYTTALKSYRTFPDADKGFGVPLLYRLFAEMEWEQGRPETALSILASISKDTYESTNKAPGQTEILKAAKFYEQRTAQVSIISALEHEREAALQLIACQALFVYLSRDIDAASQIYERAIVQLEAQHAERGVESEMLWVDYVKLLYNHARTSAHFKPAALRRVLQRALDLFPNNTVFLGLFIWNERRTKIYGRVRDFFTSALDRESTVILWLSVLHEEIHRSNLYDVNRVRSLFESAVESRSARTSIVMWTLYMEHEIRCKEYDRAKNLFYRSVRACPWSKELCMFAIRHLASYFSERELLEIQSVMMEKEIRIRSGPLPIVAQDDLLGYP